MGNTSKLSRFRNKVCLDLVNICHTTYMNQFYIFNGICLFLFLQSRSIKYPMKPKLNTRHGVMTIISIGCLVIATSGPNIYYTGYESYVDGKRRYYCFHVFDAQFNRFLYYLCISIIFISSPMTIITTAHISMWREMKNQPKLESASEEAKRQVKMRKISKIFLIIVIAYFVMTLPHIISVLVSLYYITYDKAILHNKDKLTQMVNWSDATLALLVFNSCVNAFIYGKAHSKLWKLCRQRNTDRRNKIELQKLR